MTYKNYHPFLLRKYYLFAVDNDGDVLSSGDSFVFKTIVHEGCQSLWNGTQLIAPFEGMWTIYGFMEVSPRANLSPIGVFGTREIVSTLEINGGTYIKFSIKSFAEKGDVIKLINDTSATTLVSSAVNHHLSIVGWEIDHVV